MSEYFFIATKDPVNSADTPRLFEQAASLARSGAAVAVYLVQNGVLGARALPDPAIRYAHENGVRILADDFSLRERGIAADEVQAFVEPVGMDALIGRMLAGTAPKLIWH